MGWLRSGFIIVLSLALFILLHGLTTNWKKLAFIKLCPSTSRSERIQEACKRLGINESSERKKYNCLLTDDKHKLLYCDMAKVACSTFKQLLAANTGKERNSQGDLNVHNYHYLKSIGLKKLGEFSSEEIDYRLRNYLKFIVVRHPFDRLLSTYNEKFGKVKVNYAPWFTDLITKHFGTNYSKDSHENPLITAEQFLELVATEPERFRNAHWENYFDYCHPCIISYDHVIRFETFSDDVDVILNRMKDSDGRKPQLPTRNMHRNKTRSFRELDQVFGNLDSDIIQGLLDIYGRDMDIFGYSWSDKVAGCTHMSSEGKCC